ncbi:hypothetical protein LIER_33433 [Lithospermum erythrorhizon]|uniref:Uncharacterized protein n=1 Tax=Lithospermum erythrorhizon TaxID=34254 RepID=A0AAV3RZ89_LITER
MTQTALPIDFDPSMTNKEDDREMNWSQLICGPIKIVTWRSVSPVGRSSEKLIKLLKRVEYLDHDAGKALMVDKEDYLEDQKELFLVQYQESPTPVSTYHLRPRLGRGRG